MMRGMGEGNFLKKVPLPPHPSSHPSKTFAFIESLFRVRVARRAVEDGRETGSNGEQGTGVVLNRFGPRRFSAMVIV